MGWTQDLREVARVRQTQGIRSTLAVARVAAPTAEAERNVSSSPVSEAVSGGTPSRDGSCVPTRINGAFGSSPFSRRDRGGRPIRHDPDKPLASVLSPGCSQWVGATLP